MGVLNGQGPRYTKEDFRRKKPQAHLKYNKNDGPSGYNVSSLKAVPHRYIFLYRMVSSVFSVCSQG